MPQLGTRVVFHSNSQQQPGACSLPRSSRRLPRPLPLLKAAAVAVPWQIPRKIRLLSLLLPRRTVALPTDQQVVSLTASTPIELNITEEDGIPARYFPINSHLSRPPPHKKKPARPQTSRRALPRVHSGRRAPWTIDAASTCEFPMAPPPSWTASTLDARCGRCTFVQWHGLLPIAQTSPYPATHVKSVQTCRPSLRSRPCRYRRCPARKRNK